jgi:hypothetical protein
MLELDCPVLHIYDPAPVAVSVLKPPGQIEAGDAVAETLIDPDTNTVTDADALHPFNEPVTT